MKATSAYVAFVDATMRPISVYWARTSGAWLFWTVWKDLARARAAKESDHGSDRR